MQGHVFSDEALCPACAEKQGSLVFTDTTWNRDVFQCNICDATYIWPPVEQDFKNIPAPNINFDSADDAPAIFIFSFILNEGRKSILGHESHDQKPSIMDVGCGDGHILAYFKERGWNVQGIDPQIEATAAGRRHYGIPIETARVEYAHVEPDSQDVVLSIDVLQFIGKPHDFLKACLRAMKPGGLIYLTVPNFGSAESRRDGWTWQNFLPWCYLNYFTEETVRRLLENAGFFRTKVTPFGGPEDDSLLRVV
ncbi:MAG: methyltransferase domain-containing protein, partial [Candidatus Binatia bacterium]